MSPRAGTINYCPRTKSNPLSIFSYVKKVILNTDLPIFVCLLFVAATLVQRQNSVAVTETLGHKTISLLLTYYLLSGPESPC